VRFRTFVFLTLFSFAALPWAEGAIVEGRVVDPASHGVPGAGVVVICGTSVAASATTDADGRFVTPEVGGRCELRVALDGFAAAPVALELAPGPERRDAGTVRLELSAVSESVLVSAAQVDVPLSQASSSATVITAAELRARQIATVADALRDVPGVTVTRTGSAGAVTSVFPRGGESDYTLVFIDGVQANGFGGGFDFAHLSTDNIERIEIVRGPQSALFGSNAIGAVVRIVTRSGGPVRGDASVEAGSFATRRLSASTSGGAGAWSWGAGAERLSSDGFNGTTLASGERVANDDYARTSAGVNGAWRHSSGAGLNGALRFERDERGFPGPFGSNPIGAFQGIDPVSRGRDDRWLGSLGGTLRSGRRVRTQAQATWNTIDGRFDSPFGPSTSSSRRWTARAQSDVAIRPGLDASAGIDVQRERATSTFITADGGAEIPVARSTAGYFGEARWNVADRLFVSGGLRVEDIRRDALAGLADPFSPRPPFPRDRVVAVNPRAGAAWYVRPRAGTSTKLRAAGGTGIRPPDAFELAFTDNPSLAPERSRSIEAGIDQALWSGRALIEATAFHNTFDDLIVAVGRFQQSSRYRTDNISNARARGLEVASTLRTRVAALDVRARATYTWLSTEILAVDRGDAAPPPFEVGSPLLRRPRHQWALDLSGAAGPVTAWLRGGGRGRVLDVEPSQGTFGGLFTASGYAVWSAGASWRVAREVEAFARVENLFDRAYEEAFGFPALGRGAMVGVRVAASR
jgi:outer membrane cobalamin receptor